MNELEGHLLRELTKQRMLTGTIATRIVMTRVNGNTFKFDIVDAATNKTISTVFEGDFFIGNIKTLDVLAVIKHPPPTEG